MAVQTKKNFPAKKSGAEESSLALFSSYPQLLADLKARVRSAQLQATRSANRGLIALYWQIGKSIVAGQKIKNYGKGVVERLAADLRREFPNMEGFSPLNLWQMRAFYLAYAKTSPILSQPVKELENPSPPQAILEIPWGHNLIILRKIKDPALRQWYAQSTVQHGWSRAVLDQQIESKLHQRDGKALNNFHRTLLAPQSDLAQQTLKDPYIFDFLSLDAGIRERDLEHGLLQNIEKFLLELGVGFAFVGRQVPLQVGDQNYFIDLLFYHLRLRCYVVVDLKMEPFQPEFAGKMNFYLSAIDAQKRHAQDAPSIGLLLCRERNHVTVEYALRDMRKPIGVAEWKTKLVEALPKKLQSSLPTVQELEAELAEKRPKLLKKRKTA